MVCRKKFYSDNGPPFTSREIKQFMKDRGITLRHVTPLCPQANGEAKAFMKPLAKAVKATKLEGKNWTEELYVTYRTTPHNTTGIAPTQLLYNREVRTNIPSLVKEEEVDYKELHKQARASVERKQTKAQEYTDAKRKARNKELSVGTKVLVKQERKNKFTPAFDPKPLIVEQVKGTMITARRGDYTITRNVSHFKRFMVKDEVEDTEITTDEEDTTDDETTPNQVGIPADQSQRRYPARIRNRPRFYKDEVR